MYRLVQTTAQEAHGGNTVARAVQHPIAQALLSYVVSAPNGEAVAEEIAQEFQAASLTSALELHQCIENFLTKVRKLGGELQAMSGFFVEGTCIFCGIHGAVLLKRGNKVGKILKADETIGVIEGKWQPSDAFIFTLSNNPEENDQLQQLIQFPLSGEQLQLELHHLLRKYIESNVISYLFFEEGPAPVMATQPSINQAQPIGQVGAVSTSQNAQNSRSFFGQVKTSLKQFLMTVKNLPRMIGFWRQRFLSKDIYIQQRDPKKIVRIVLPVIVGVILLGGGFLIWRSRQVEQVKAAEAIIQPIDTRIIEIKGIVEQDPLTARKQTEEVIVQLENALDQHKDQKIVANRLDKKLRETRAFYDGISGLEELAVLPTFFDLRFVESDFIAHRVSIQEDNLFFLDQEKRKIIALNIPKKQSTPLPIGDLAKLQDAISSSRNLFLLGPGIYQLPLSGSQTNTTQIRADEDALQNAQFIRLFNSNLYVVNKEKRNIYRYALGENNALSDSVGWVRAGQTIPFEDLNSFAIDSDVWLTTTKGEIIKMTTGKQVEFAVTGLKNPFNSPLILYTSEDSANLYVLEPAQKRVVILTKKGEFLREVKSSSLASTTGIVANEQLKKAFVVSGSLVFEIDL